LKETKEKNIGMTTLVKLAQKGKTGTIVLKNSIAKNKHIFCRLKPQKSDFQNPP